MSKLQPATDGKGPRWIGDNLPDLPKELQYAQDLPPKVTDKYVLFFGYDRKEPECCLQQWYPSEFTETDKKSGKKRKFHTSEQYMMYHKALLMGDNDVAQQILDAPGPGDAKSLGRKARGLSSHLEGIH